MSCISPTAIRKGKAIAYVPCGQCVWCRQRLQNEWFVRLLLECQNYPFASFVTFTYDDDHLPQYCLDVTTGELQQFRGSINYDPCRQVIYPTFSKRDVQNYFKRLRKKINKSNLPTFYMKRGQIYQKTDKPKLKYFLVSEYGSENGRPHYHAIVFSNMDLDLTQDWKQGNVVQVPAEPGSLRYVTKYLLKGENKPSEIYDDVFRLNSQHLGYDYFFNHQEFFLDYPTIQIGNSHYAIPRAYRKWLYDLLDKKHVNTTGSTHCDLVQGLIDSWFDESATSRRFEHQYQNSNSDLDYDQFVSSLRQKYVDDYRKQIKIKKQQKL